MRAREVIANDTIRMYVQSTLEFYLSLLSSEGEMPGDVAKKRVQWCHGSPGFIAIFTEAHRIFGLDRYLAAAKLTALFFAKEGILKKGMMLCHGTSGNIYQMLDLYAHSRDPDVLSQAISMLLVALKTPQLTDPKSWVSYDWLPGSVWLGSPLWFALLASDVLAHQDSLGNVSLVTFGRVW